MLKPFFQGKLDTFCAIYAVLNALRLTHGIQTLKARDILNETLLSLAGKPGALRAVLEQDTDYMQLVDDMIQARQQRYPLLVEKPFAEGEAVSPDALWEACREWLAPGEGRCILFRFLRHLTPETPPMNRHWTCADRSISRWRPTATSAGPTFSFPGKRRTPYPGFWPKRNAAA